MKIYINSNYEIKAINQYKDNSLQEIEIDRELVFGNMSDFMMLNYCYEPYDCGYSIYPTKDYNMLELLDSVETKLNMLIENQKAILRGDMQTLAYNLYPRDFIKEGDINE